MAALAVARVELAPGYTISRIIKGGWQLAGGHGDVTVDAAVEDMRRYVEAGITTFDCADIYTGVEELIGVFLQRHPKLRRRVQVHTKLVPDRSALATLAPGDVKRIVDRSLRRLGVDTLDLVQLAWWDYDVPRYVDAALALADLQRFGKIRYLGATNFDVPRLKEILEAGVPLVAHQVQYSVVDRRVASDMTAFCEQHDIALLSYGSLLGGFLNDRYLGASAPVAPLENRSLTKYGLIIDEFGDWHLYQELLAALHAIAQRHEVSIASVGLAWGLHRPAVAAAIVGARHGKHLDSTLAALALELDDDERASIDAVLARGRGPSGAFYALEREVGGRHAEIMRYDLSASADKGLVTPPWHTGSSRVVSDGESDHE